MVETRSHRRYLVLLAALALVATACGGSDESSTETTSAAATETSAEPTTTSAPATTEETAAETTEVEEELEGFPAVAAEIETFIENKNLNGAGLIVVHRDDGVVYHEHFGEFTEDRISLIASSSKMISAGVLLKLQEDGLLDINKPVSDYVDWGAEDSPITTAQLISNSSGLVGLGPDLLYAPYVCQWSPDTELEACAESVFGGPDDDADVIEPDTEFRYGGAQWQVAGAVAEAVSGKPWAQLVDETFAEPCGLDSLGYISLGSVFTGAPGYPTTFAGNPDGVAPTENPNIEGGGYVSTGDYGELLLMHLRGGVCGETQVLSQESLDTMHTDRIGETYDGNAGSEEFGYGMGWWVNRETGRIEDAGAFGTVPWLDLDDGYGAYLVIEDTSDVGQELAGLIRELVHDAVVGS